ncbi:hypothetical protein VCSRO84_3607 [Vibrio cholerae]|nr:hypothetical protein VCSRO119_3606 [Vibrio cholerae]GIA22255.1 hypothetical protein VCSRO84_3607 [Vibrio cholerae]GIA64123.1 hypothetical protein VCSRO87_3619 [Vibrio cholerae]
MNDIGSYIPTMFEKTEFLVIHAEIHESMYDRY